MNQSPSTPRNFTRNLLFFSALLCALLISVWARAAQVTLAWDANTESDLAGYRVHYGTASGTYTVTVAVDKNTPTCTVLTLTAGQTYYFAASAYNTSGASSGYSNEVSYTIAAPNTAPSTPSTPAGTASGVVNRSLAFTTSATDPEGQTLQYRYDWGGGVLSNWGAAAQARAWASAGQYCVKAQSRDSLGLESGWSACRAVTIAPDRDGDGIPDAEDLDNDNDGMPDAWEIAHGLNPLVNDAAGDLDGDGISNLAEYLAGSDPTVPAPNDPPQAPVAVTPTGRALVTLTPTLRTGAFTDPDAGDRHAETRWQIMQGSNSLIVLDVASTEELTQLTIPSLVLDENTEYYWRAMFYDQRGAASAWSAAAWFTTDFSLTDSDGNGIPDDQETQPVTGSGEGVKTVQTGKGDTKVGIGAQASSGVAVVSIESMDPDNDIVDVDVDGIGDEMPFGLVNFKVLVATPGDEAVVTVYFSEPVPPKGKWYKYDSIRKRWFDYSRFATFSSDRRSMTLVLADGGAGDADEVVNGIIIDPAGVLVESSGGGGGSLVGGVVDGVGSVVGSIGDAAGGGGCFIGATEPVSVGALLLWLVPGIAAAIGRTRRRG
jgi:chitinase